MKTIQDRLSELREVMHREHLAAFIFPSTDPHSGEYVPDHWMGRRWISGFNGSAGTAVVTMHSAALWTDSRYFIAAADQLQGSDFTLMKERIDGSVVNSKRLTSPRWALTAGCAPILLSNSCVEICASKAESLFAPTLIRLNTSGKTVLRYPRIKWLFTRWSLPASALHLK